MKRKAKALVSENKNEPPAARTLEVSLDRADNVIEGGPLALNFLGLDGNARLARYLR